MSNPFELHLYKSLYTVTIQVVAVIQKAHVAEHWRFIKLFAVVRMGVGTPRSTSRH